VTHSLGCLNQPSPPPNEPRRSIPIQTN
jgi:hypothetical protein